ncbi:MFS transporter [Leifsonia aquatica]|uniref:FSR family fosmidomycin resistance protein-like MFS transporter n=3 Tax=Leifsonia aquatica TaxID=144185 RepID=A0A7W4UZ72_LEIAQ|nr:MFS transporter [Leifsonia aquatica]MBB2968657.1 FSR family fosmidomycin resistance protein-like MFS transporter [Leifsonia aquatica]
MSEELRIEYGRILPARTVEDAVPTPTLIPRRRARFWSLVSTHTMNDFQTGAVAAMLPSLIAQQHYDYAAAAGIVLASTALSSITQPVFGWLSDRLDLRWMVPAGLAFAALCVAAAGLTSGSYWLTWVIVALSGVGVAAYHPPATVEARATGGGTNRSMSIFSVGGNVGVALAPLLVGLTAGTLGLGSTPLLLVPTAAVIVVYLAVRRHRAREVAPAHPVQEAHEEVAPSTTVTAALPAAAADAWGRFAWLLVVISFWSLAYIGTTSFIALYVAERFQAGAGVGAVALAVFPAAGAIGTLLGGFLADRFGRRIVIPLGYAVAALAAGAIVAAPSAGVAIVATALLGVALFVPFALHVTLSHAYLPRHIGTASGITLGLSTTLGGFLAPALGAIADGSSITIVFVVIAAALVVAFVASLFLRDRRDPIDPSGLAAGAAGGADEAAVEESVAG